MSANLFAPCRKHIFIKLRDEMVLFTLISRLSDALPLVASTDVTGGGREVEEHKQQAKAIVKRLNSRSPSRMSIDSGTLSFNYIMDDGVVYLTLTDKSYPKKLAFSYLLDVQREFVNELRKEHGDQWVSYISTVGRAYAFLKFDRTLQRLKRDYLDPGSRANSSRLSEELGEIQNIMRKNIQEVLDRGEKLESVSRISSKLVEESKQFKWGAKKLNRMDAWRRFAPAALAIIIVLGVGYWRFFL